MPNPFDQLPFNPQGVGVAWFHEKDYDRLRQMFDDGHKLPLTYKEWLQQVENRLERFKDSGTPIVKVYIEPEEFAAWCRAEGCKVDAQARSHFAALGAKRQDDQRKAN